MSGQQAAQAPVCQYLRPLALSGGGLESVCVWVETKHPPCLFGEILPCCSAQNIVGNQQDLASRPSLVTGLWRDLKRPSPPPPLLWVQPAVWDLAQGSSPHLNWLEILPPQGPSSAGLSVILCPGPSLIDLTQPQI